MTMKSGEITWLHLDLIKDEQWDSKEPKLKGKSCNVVSILPDDDNITIASLYDSEDEKHVLAALDAEPQPIGT